MSLSGIIVVNVSSAAPAVSQAGFGKALILSANAAFAERTRTYSSAAEFLADAEAAISATDPEYLAAAAHMAAAVAPPEFMIGRRALPPTQRYKISVKAVENSVSYSVRAGAEYATITSSISASNDAIVSSLVSALNGSSLDPCLPAGFTATVQGTGGSTYVRVLATTPGDFVALEAMNTGLLSIEQDHADPGIATDLAAIALEDNTWYGLCLPSGSKAEIVAMAGWVENAKKLAPTATSDTPVANDALSTATDVAAALKTAGYARTGIIYDPKPDDFAGASWLGKCLPMDPGSETWMFKALAGVSAASLTSTQQTNIEAKHASYYADFHGVNCTIGSKAASGAYYDMTRGVDWLEARIGERLATLALNNAKIPYTDDGIGMVAAQVRAQLQDGIKAGLIAANPAPVVAFPKAADVSSATKATRRLTGTFTATGAGAIEGFTINGTVTV